MVDVRAASQAYSNALNQISKTQGGGGLDKAARDPATSFSELVTQAISDTAGAVRQSEKGVVNVVTGKAEIADVVTAVNNAEMALDTVVAVRDKIISAYQEILRMPI
ncbi:MAG: flagellar hook-basal body complex protein FliE [Sneathiellaceae bacterium]|uniref:flagellar hook-basal body complex protein FliE n=1 Tax=Marinovum algicola TaxID=42444 RepID=UPI0032ED1ECC